MALNSEEKTLIVPSKHENEVISSLNFDATENRTYWISSNKKYARDADYNDVSSGENVYEIKRSFIDGSQEEVVVDFGIGVCEDLAIDWVAGNLYWTDVDLDRIEVARLNGEHRRVILWRGISNPYSITVDPIEGYIYWSQNGSPQGLASGAKISKARLDGSNAEVMFEVLATSLTIDYVERKLYWFNLNPPRIQVYPLMGGFDTQPATITQSPPGEGLSGYGEWLFWASVRSIFRANKTDGSSKTEVLTMPSHELITGLFVFHETQQSGWNPCAIKNGKCNELCFAQPAIYSHRPSQQYPYSYRCECPSHYVMKERTKGNYTCSAPDNFLLYSRKNEIFRLVLGEADVPDVRLPIKKLSGMVSALEYDMRSRSVYWINAHRKTIERATDDGKNHDIVVSSNKKYMKKHRKANRRRYPRKSSAFPYKYNGNDYSPYDLAIDPYGENLYWSCQRTNRINVTNMNTKVSLGSIINGSEASLVPGSVGGVLDKMRLVRPRSIAIYWKSRVLFFVNSATNSIESILLDGSKRELIASEMESPANLAVDQKEGVLYWTEDGGLNTGLHDSGGRIRKYTLHGQKMSLEFTRLRRPVGLAQLHRSLYWADRAERTISRLEFQLPGLARTSDTILQGERASRLTDIIAVDIEQYELNHPCYEDQCSHFCLLGYENKAVCSCPPDMELSRHDDKKCVPKVKCKDKEFRCLSGKTECIPQKWRCDGKNECEDGSDEIDCGPCETNGFRCRAAPHKCILKLLSCEGGSSLAVSETVADIAVNVSGIPHSEIKKLCKNPVWSNGRCDGITDCDDASDETYCVAALDEQTNEMQTIVVILIVVVIFLFVALAGVVLFCTLRKKKIKSGTSHKAVVSVGPNHVFPEPNNTSVLGINSSLRRDGSLISQQIAPSHAMHGNHVDASNLGVSHHGSREYRSMKLPKKVNNFAGNRYGRNIFNDYEVEDFYSASQVGEGKKHAEMPSPPETTVMLGARENDFHDHTATISSRRSATRSHIIPHRYQPRHYPPPGPAPTAVDVPISKYSKRALSSCEQRQRSPAACSTRTVNPCSSYRSVPNKFSRVVNERVNFHADQEEISQAPPPSPTISDPNTDYQIAVRGSCTPVSLKMCNNPVKSSQVGGKENNFYLMQQKNDFTYAVQNNPRADEREQWGNRDDVESLCSFRREQPGECDEDEAFNENLYSEDDGEERNASFEEENLLAEECEEGMAEVDDETMQKLMRFRR